MLYGRCQPSQHLHPRAMLLVGCLVFAALVFAQDTFAQDTRIGGAPTDAAFQRVVGAIKAIDAGGITLTADTGDEVHATLTDSTRIVRVAPGEKDLKNATPLQKQDLQIGDRILVRGRPGADAHSLAALAIIVMKQSDVAAKQQKEREDWQKRGVGGLVTAVDQATSTITVSQASFGSTKSVVVHTSKSTILRRYAPDSVKFDDAKIAPLDQIKVGDQLRARGSKNEDGTELNAEEVVSGTFRNLAGQITAVDSVANTLTLKDAISKQTVVVKVTGDAQLRKLPPEFAQRIAMRLKGAAANGIPGAAAALGGGAASGDRPRGQGAGQGAGGPGQGGPGGAFGGMGGRGGGPPDIQQILSRMPAASLSDLQKGDAVMIVTTAGDSSGAVNAITLLAGVEPILTAAPNASQAMMLSPWSLGSGNAEAAANP
jgi:co-chaperonin GroES (HSP10)